MKVKLSFTIPIDDALFLAELVRKDIVDSLSEAVRRCISLTRKLLEVEVVATKERDSGGML